MSQMVQQLRVFLSSPGDVAAERKAATDLLNRLNKDPAFRGRIAIDVVAWDTPGAPPLEATLAPQDAINRGLPLPADCDIVIVILWSRIGTPLPDHYSRADGSYFKSGTEWEYENAVAGSRERKSPVVLLYRSMKGVQLKLDDPRLHEKCNQLVLLKSFFESLGNEAGYNQYKTLSEFKERLGSDLRQILTPLATHRKHVEPGDDRTPPPAHNLPPRTYGELLGRAADKDRVISGLKSTAPVITIEGFPGVGKTSLALEVAYSCLKSKDQANAGTVSFEHIVWLSAKNKPEQQLWLDEVLNEIARVMDYSALTQMPERDEKISAIYSLLGTHKVLVIIDNFDTIADQDLMHWILNTPEKSKVLITSHSRPFPDLESIDIEGLKDVDALNLIRRKAEAFGLDFVTAKSNEELMPLIENTGGNPQAIVLSLGIIKGGTLSPQQVITGLRTNRNIHQVFQHLFYESWRLISEDAQRVLLTVPLFAGASSIAKEALRAASGVSEDDFDRALAQLVGFKLLQVDFSSARYQSNFNLIRYLVHPLTHTFARARLDERADFEEEARARWSRYFLGFVGDNVVRDKPEVRYWNALVSDRMNAIDAEWSSIHEVLKWADKHREDQLLLDLVMLLVHYMDSRFLNVERVEYIKDAIKIAERIGHKEEEALLCLDALAWTYVEEGRLEEAYDQIMRGRDIVEQYRSEIQTADDLMALSFAWRARVRIEQGQSEDANRFIDHALSCRCNPWITSRVYMAAGDIALKQNRNKEALRFYEKTAKTIVTYGGEGHGYQIDPRIGLALLAVGNLEEARKRFNALRANEAIPIGKLYGDYGLAMIAYKEGRKKDARHLINETRKSLSRRTTPSNLLFKLTDQLFQELEDDDAKQ